MGTNENFSSSRQPEQNLTDLDQAVNYIAAAVANLHEAALHLKNCNATRLMANLVRARREIRKSWQGMQQIKQKRSIAKNPAAQDLAPEASPGGDKPGATPAAVVPES